MLPLFQSAWASCILKKPFSSYYNSFGLSRFFSYLRCGDNPKPLHFCHFAGETVGCTVQYLTPGKSCAFISVFLYAFSKVPLCGNCFSLCCPQFLLPALSCSCPFPCLSPKVPDAACIVCSQHLRKEKQPPLVVPKNGTSREIKPRRETLHSFSHLLFQKVFPRGASTQSLKPTICEKTPFSFSAAMSRSS